MSLKKFLFPMLLMGTVWALVLRAFARPAATKSPAKSTAFAEIDAYIEQQRQRLNIPGVSLAIVEGDRIVHQRGFGHAHAHGDAPSPQTPFFIGSLTKSFTAVAVMQLVEAGKVELDAPVQRYLPWFRVADAQASAQITVRHLLNQTSGLPMSPGAIVLADFDNSPTATERQVRALATLKITHPVGSRCQYSNLNYNILGLIIEAISGESYADYIQDQIFAPLGMDHSYTSKAAAKPAGLATGYRYWFSLPFPAPELPVPYGSLPSGQLISCAEDMAHYLIAHLNGGCCDGVQILSGAGIDELHRGVKDYIVGGKSSGLYGMGWFDIDIGQTKTYSHGGNVPDFSAFMVIIPGQKKGIVLLANADPYGLPPVIGEVGLNLTALLAGQKPAPIRLDFIRWLLRLLPLIPLLQVAVVLATRWQFRRWQQNNAGGPNQCRLWGQHLILTLMPNLTFTVILVYLWHSRLLRFLRLFMPDVAGITMIGGSFALVWSIMRTGLLLQVQRKNKLSRLHVDQNPANCLLEVH